MGRGAGGNYFTDVDISLGPGQGSYGGNGARFRLWESATGVFSDVARRRTKDTVPRLLAHVARGDSVRGNVFLHLRHVEEGVHG